MSVELFVTVLIIFVTIFASVVLLKFWMDFKIGVWDREHHINHISCYNINTVKKFQNNKRKIRDNLNNKSESRDIIIDCEAEVISEEEKREFVYLKNERLLK